MKPPDPDDFTVIPRLEEYYRPKAPLVGWGIIPEAWRRTKEALPFVASGVFFALLLLVRPAEF